MNKPDLIGKISEKTGSKISKADVERVLGCFVETVKEALRDKDEVRLIGFGTFTSGLRKARMGRNPKTREEIKIPACRYPRFRPGKDFKDCLN